MTARDAAAGSPVDSEDAAPGPSLPTRFHIWGSRGSRNAVGSRIGNATSCYSLAVGADLYVFDAGSGLLPLSVAMQADERLAHIKRVHLLISHAHWDHWEGLKDADWMWRKDNGIELTILAPSEALQAIHKVWSPPSFVPLEILAMGTLASLRFVELAAGATLSLPGATVEALALNHYSGVDPHRRHLDTLGYRVAVDGGPTIAYICDHEPTEKTSEIERTALTSADLAIIDASYGDVSEHAFGHGSIESVAQLARSFPEVNVLAAHHGPMRTDEQIEAAAQRHGSDLPRFSLARDGACQEWNETVGRFVPAPTESPAVASSR